MEDREMAKYTIYTTDFHGGGVEYETSSLRDALAYKPGADDCECGCRSAPIWTKADAHEVEARLARLNLYWESPDYIPDHAYLVWLPDGNVREMILGEPPLEAHECGSPYVVAK
ncbi:MAG: hypothetical protein D6773_08500 [Alphaproteobacteria bacterium]|nr:MAG: hypothetical protein D6773_08500 [Alphaproteobacteria bacterium]